ncbi:VanZ family protein [Ornithinimicrobium cavernae]|uniref:VanZ family protein n=1 Tax=Ornithinimicrobium cavernae TaxID=2666047 RepID=UPI001F2881DD|nr:VanZ family protein [Ornithinimicrobium cavernae]
MPTSPPDHLRGVCRGLGWLLLLTLLLAQVWALYLLVPSPGDPLFPGQDKVGHALLFGVPLALSLALGSRPVSLGILLHALASEPLQGLLTSTRTPDAWDTVADLAGIALAVLVVELARRRRPVSRVAEPDTVGALR